MSYGVNTITVHKKLKLDKRANSTNWYARLSLDNGKRIVRSTKTEDLEQAKERAIQLYYETKARIENKLPAQTRKFKHVAKHAIHRMEQELIAGYGRTAYKDYISALERWLIPYFGNTDIDKIDLAALKKFDQWRTKEHKTPFTHSGINNHNAALNRVLDEAESNGWIVKAMRPTLLNKGKKSESRGSFTEAEHKKIYTALRRFHKKTSNAKAAATRETLREYVLFLANTGVRHGTEALGLRWKNIDWHKYENERYLVVSVDGKTGVRSVVARDTVEKYLDRQRTQNPRLEDEALEDLIAAKSDEFVFTTRQGEVATIHNLNRAFNSLLDELDLKMGADGKTRTLYSYRHYYATRDLARGMSSHMLAKQIGTSTPMIDKNYSKYSSLLNAHLHSGRSMKRDNGEPAATAGAQRVVDTAFAMLADGSLDEAGLLATLQVENDEYAATDDIRLNALNAMADGHLSEVGLLKIMGG